MSEVSQPIGFVLFFASGFLFVQVLHRVGVARQPSDSQRILWSILLSLPIRWIGTQFVSLAGLEIDQGLTFEMVFLVVALVIGFVLALIRRLFFFE